MQNEATKLLTITEAAEILKVSQDTLRRWEAKGIVTPVRTRRGLIAQKGGVRRYTLLDLKIAKLNKRKVRFLDLPTLLRKNIITSKHDLKVAFFTSVLWVLGIILFNFLAPKFLSPTNPAQAVYSDQIRSSNPDKIAR